MNPNLIISLAFGPYREWGEQLTLPLMRDYAGRCHADFYLVDTLSRPERPYPWEMMEQMYGALGDYERLLCVPVDGIIKRDARDVFALLPPGTYYGFDEYPFDPCQCKPCWLYAQDMWPDEFPRSTDFPKHLYNTGPMLVDQSLRELFKGVSNEVEHGMVEMAVVNMRLHQWHVPHKDVRPEVFNASHIWFDGQPVPDILHVMWSDLPKREAVLAWLPKMGW